MGRQAGRMAIRQDRGEERAEEQAEERAEERAAAAKVSFESYGGTGPENYERYFVPAIAGPLAGDLVEAAALRPGDRVLDLACGTGIVARLAAGRVGPTGTVTGLDINPGMLAVARAATPPGTVIGWHQAPADDSALPDDAFDVVVCQLGLQFFPDQAAALREMHRVLAPGARIVLNVPGPAPEPFLILAEELARHIRPELAPFVQQVFSLHDTRQLQELLAEAGFTGTTAEPASTTLALPPPAEFLWQYVHSTPLAAAAAGAGEAARAALERDIVTRWKPFTHDDRLMLELRVVTAAAWTA
jgi:ubiquinone/menaquinone biosynthesis C-methylase UbiE